MVFTQRGFSFIELLLACALMLLLMAALMNTFLAVMRLSRYQKALVELQGNGRLISYYLTRQLRHAGNWDCITSQPLTTESPAIEGMTAATARRLLQQPIVARSDVFMIRSCRKYHRRSRWVTTAYFVAQAFQAKRRKALGLYEKIITSVRLELFSGVVDMQIRYGVARSDKVTGVIYQTVSQVQHWQQVRSVEVALLLRSRDNVLSKPQRYWYNGKRQTASDRHFYLPWIVYVSLREPAHAKS